VMSVMAAVLISVFSALSTHGVSKLRIHVRVPVMHSINSFQISWLIANKFNHPTTESTVSLGFKDNPRFVLISEESRSNSVRVDICISKTR
ncbi:hypothetical protein PENTCL1PPCAC_13116, partial [Pristionchus entomophagus]